MKNVIFFLLLVSFIACTNTMDKQINSDDLPKVIEKVKKSNQYTENEKGYIIEKLQESVGYTKIGEALKLDMDVLPTFKEEINILDSTFKANKKANQQLEAFLKNYEVRGRPIHKNNGYLIMNINFNNNFNKSIRYITLDYNYTDKYEDTYFNESAKLTDEIAGEFKGTKKISINEKYNDVSKFLYSEMLYPRPEDSVKNKAFMKKGFNLKVSKVVFEDKSEIDYIDSKYF